MTAGERTECPVCHGKGFAGGSPYPCVNCYGEGGTVPRIELAEDQDSWAEGMVRGDGDAPDSDEARRFRVLAEVNAERTRQDLQWGGPSHDDGHRYDDWRRYREKFEERVGSANKFMDSTSGADIEKGISSQRDALVKIAALAVAQLEQHDRFYGWP